MNRTPLALALLVCLLGCGHQRPPVVAPAPKMESSTRTTKRGPPPASTAPEPAISRDEACRIAATEAMRRRGKAVVVESCRFEQDRWLVFLDDRDSDAIGGHCGIEVGTNGAVVRYYGGH
jgi:hypothetical protein